MLSRGALSTNPFNRDARIPKIPFTLKGPDTRAKTRGKKSANDASVRAFDNTNTGRVNPLEKAAIMAEIRRLQSAMPELVHSYLGIRLLADEEIINMGGVSIERTKGEGNLNTLSDPRMGPENPTTMCAQCKGTNCVGHFGRIDFALPIYHPMYLSTTNGSIYKLMSCICPTCCNLYATEKSVAGMGISKYRGLARLNAISDRPPKKLCRFANEKGHEGCVEPITFKPKPSKELGTIVYTRGKDPTELRIDATRALEMLLQLSDADARLLGFADRTVPLRFISQRMLVPPPRTRISKNTNNTAPVPNILTTHLDRIIEANNRLKTAINGELVASNVSGALRALYIEVKEFMARISGNIQGKEAMIRGSMTSKRGDHCARMPIVPEDGIEVGQVILPADVIASLTPKETVTSINIEYLQRLLDDGRVTFYTRFVGEDEGVTREPQPGITRLEIGDEIERWLEDGDWIIVLRPPNLHKQNIFAVRAVIQPNRSTLGIHLSYTTALHGDFDGDEMIMWAVLGAKERFEAEYLMDIRRNMMATLNPYPIVAPVYDTVIGCYLMTGDGVTVDDEIFDYTRMILMEKDQLLTYEFRMQLANVNPRSGRALFSMLLPEDFEYRSGRVSISSGILLRGNITSKQISTKARSLVHDIHITYGWERAANFVTDVTRCNRAFLDQRGFSVGYKDFLYGDTDEARGLIHRAMMKAEKEAELISLDDPARTRKINEIVGGVMDVKNEIYKMMSPDNRLGKMSSDQSGAKGSRDNALLTTGTPFQVVYKGEILKPELAGGTRISSHYRRGSKRTLQSTGLTTMSYLRGISFNTMFDHYRDVRTGQAQIASGTPKVGTVQRRIAKLMENARIGLLGDTNIGDFRLQQLYGADGFETSNLVPVGDEISFVDVSTLFNMYNAESGWVQTEAAPLSYFESGSVGEMKNKEFTDYTKRWRNKVLKGIITEYDPPEYISEDPVISGYYSKVNQWYMDYTAMVEENVRNGLLDLNSQTESDAIQYTLVYLKMSPLPSLTEIQKNMEDAGLIRNLVLEQERELRDQDLEVNDNPFELGDAEAGIEDPYFDID